MGRYNSRVTGKERHIEAAPVTDGVDIMIHYNLDASVPPGAKMVDIIISEGDARQLAFDIFAMLDPSTEPTTMHTPEYKYIIVNEDTAICDEANTIEGAIEIVKDMIEDGVCSHNIRVYRAEEMKVKVTQDVTVSVDGGVYANV